MRRNLQVSRNVSLDGGLTVAFIAPFVGAAGNTCDIVTTTVPNGITGKFASIKPPAGTSFKTAMRALVLTQQGSSSSPAPIAMTGSSSIQSPGSGSSPNSTDLSIQSINDGVGLTEVDRIRTQEPRLEEQRRATRSVGLCGPDA